MDFLLSSVTSCLLPMPGTRADAPEARRREKPNGRRPSTTTVKRAT